LSKRGEDVYALTNPCGRFIHNKSVQDMVDDLENPLESYNIRFKNTDPENLLELV